MPEYIYSCEEHGNFTRIERMHDEHKNADCPVCGETSFRVFTVPPTHFHTSGFHGRKGEYVGDFDQYGDKLDRLNRGWSKAWGGEKPPPPSKEVPKNSGELH